MANSFAPVQLLRTDWNPDIWTAFDNGTDQRTMYAVTMNPSVLPTDKNKYGVGCVLIVNATAQIYLNVGTTNIPNWQPFGPGSGLPLPFIPGYFLTNDGTTAYWAPVSGGGGGGGNIITNQTPSGGTYPLLVGSVDGTNQVYTVSTGKYLSGTLVVYLNGLAQLQGPSDDWQETSPGSGTFTFNTAPLTGDIITATFEVNTYHIDQTPSNGTYGTLAGAVNGTNQVYTVSNGSYTTGTLVVYLNGLVQLQGTGNDWTETVPGSGTFTFTIAPLTGDIITAQYQ